MPYIDFNNLDAAKVGATDVTKIYVGSSLLWMPASSGSITHVGGAVLHATTTSLTPSLGAYQAGDLAIGYAHADQDTQTFTAPAGWTTLHQGAHISGRDRSFGLYYKVLSASETDPTFTQSISEQMSASVNVYRGVNQVTPFDVVYSSTSHSSEGANSILPNAPSITTVTNGAAVVTIHAASHTGITTPTAPTGYTLTTSKTNSHVNQYVAHLLDAGPSGVKSPGQWLHNGGVDLSTPEYSVFTLALRPA